MTTAVYFAADDPSSLYVATTFGLLVSHDAGCTFYWVCEAEVGYGGVYQPSYAVARDGTLFATSYTGLRVSRDGGCSWQTATAELALGDPDRIADRYVDAVGIGPTGEIWAGTDNVGQTNDVFVSADNGVTFTSSGLASDTLRWTSLVVAPGDPARVYAIGDGPSPQLERHDAAGWTALPLTGVVLATSPSVSVAAVDPTNRDVVYLVSTGGGPTDHLYRSSDGGVTFADVLSPPTGWIRNVLVRDAQTMFVTTMEPAGSFGIGGPAYVSTTGGVSFAPAVGAPQLSYLGVAPDGALVGCASNWDPDFMAVTRSADGGNTWSKVFRFVELAGALACPPDQVTCEQTADNLLGGFGATGPVCGAHSVDAGMPVENPAPPTPGGCCDAAGSQNLPWAFGLVAWVAVGCRRRRALTSASCASDRQ